MISDLFTKREIYTLSSINQTEIANCGRTCPIDCYCCYMISDFNI